MSSILDIYRRNMPSPDATPFHYDFYYALGMTVNVQPSSGKALVIDRIQLMVSSTFDVGAGTRDLQFQSSLGVAPYTVGVLGIASPIAGATWAKLLSTSAALTRASLMAFCDETVSNAFDGTGGSMTTKDWIGVRHVRPCWKLTNSEYLVIKDTGAGGALTSTLLISLNGWFFNDVNAY